MQIEHLSVRSIKLLIEADTANLKNENFYLQVLSIKEFDTSQNTGDSKKTVKLRC